MNVDPRRAAFAGDVSRLFCFLAEEFGFSGPDDDGGGGWIGYSSVPWTIWIGLSERDSSVVVSVNLDDGKDGMHALVRQVVSEARLKVVGQLGESARTRLAMKNTLTTHARALRQLVPILLSDRGRSLMEALNR